MTEPGTEEQSGWHERCEVCRNKCVSLLISHHLKKKHRKKQKKNTEKKKKKTEEEKQQTVIIYTEACVQGNSIEESNTKEEIQASTRVRCKLCERKEKQIQVFRDSMKRIPVKRNELKMN